MGTFTKTIKSLLLASLLFVSVHIFAGTPTWTRVDYTSSTTFVGIVEINNPWTQSFAYKPVAGDYIGAFVGTECRMIAQIFSSNGNLYVSSVIQGGDTCVGDPGCTSAGKELVTFQLWSNDSSKAFSPVKGDTTSNPGGNIGSTNPYVIGRPKTGKDLLTLSITGATLSPAFSSATTSYVDTLSTIPASTAYTYTSSDRSTVSVVYATSLTGTLAQRTTTITVTAEDGTTKVYTIVYASSCTLTTAPTLSASNGTICAGQTSTLNASGSGTAFTWYSDAAATKQLATGASYTVTPSATTTYYATQSNTVCTSPIGTLTVTVNPLPSVNAGTNSATCANTSLSLSPTVSNGTSPYTYTWSPATNLSSTTVLSPVFNSASSLTATYTLSVTDSKGCKASGSVTITANPLPTITLSASPSSICYGSNSVLTASGGKTYVWSNGLTGSINTVSPTTTFIDYLTGTDANGCKNTASTTVTVNPIPTVSVSMPGTSKYCVNSGAQTISFSPVVSAPATGSLTGVGVSGTTFTPSSAGVGAFTITFNYVDANGCKNSATTLATVVALPTITATASPATICYGNTTTVSATGGTSYTWDSGIGATSSTTVSPISATTYSVTGTDANSCSNTSSVKVSVNNSPTITASASNSPICSGLSTVLSAKGGTTYVWSNGINSANTTVSPITTMTYNVTGTDANGCKNTASASVTVNKLPTIVASAANTGICIGSSTTISANGGTSYVWNNGLPSVASDVVSPKTTTIYNVTGTDANSCTGTSSVSVVVYALPTVSLVANQGAICNGSSSTLTASGASTYVWDNGLSVGTNHIVTPTTSTTYSVTGTDGNSCSNTATASVNVTTPAIPSAKDVSIVVGSAIPALTATGGTNIKWYNSTDSLLASSTSYTPSADTAVGVYSFKVTNTVNGCESSPITVTFTVSSCTTQAPTVSPTSQTICQGQSFSAFTATTGTNIKWYDGNNNVLSTTSSYTPTTAGTYFATQTSTGTNACESPKTNVTTTVNALPAVSINPVSTLCANSNAVTVTGSPASGTFSGTSISSSGLFNPNVSSGNYTITYSYTDGNNCTNSATTSITVNAVPTVAIGAGSSALCIGSSTTVTASGATTYVWDNGLGAGTSNSITPLANTTYNVTGTTNGCSANAGISIIVNKLPTVIATSSPASICYGLSSVISASGASSYSWNNGVGVANGKTVSPTITTTYTVTGTDNNSCKNTATALVTVNQLPKVLLSLTSDTVCSGSSTTVTASGAATYSWDNGNGIGTIKMLYPTASTTYNVTGTDVNGCSATASASVVVNQLPAVSISMPGTGVYCANAKPQTITVSPVATGSTKGVLTGTGVSGITFDPSLAQAGVPYTITYSFTDANGCQNLATTSATVNALPIVDANVTSPSICTGSSTTISATGGVSYSWNNGLGSVSSGTVSPTATTTYFVTGTDGNGCTNTATATVTVHALPSVSITAGATAICNGSSATITAGGANSYTWDNSLNSVASNTVSPITTTTYNVVGTDANSCSNKASVTITVTTPALPTANDISVSVNAPDPTLTASGTSIRWYDASKTTLLQTGSSYTPTVSTSTATSVKYEVTNTVNNCESVPITVTLTISSCTVAAPSVDKATVEACSGKAFGTVTATGSNIKWYNSQGVLLTSASASFTPTAAGDYYASQTNTCEGPKTKITAISNPLPVVTLPIIPALCANGTPYTINPSPTGGSFSGMGVDSSGIFEPTVGTGTYTVLYSYSDSKGCSNNATTSIVVNAVPASPKINPVGTLCGTSNVTLTQTGGVNVTWTSGTIVINPALTGLAPNTYTYNAQSNLNGCVSSLSSVTFTVNPIPAAPVTSSETVCQGETGTLTATGVGTIAWYNALDSNLANSKSISVSVAGAYYATQTINSCESPEAVANLVFNAKPSAISITSQTITIGDAIPTFSAPQSVNWLDDNKGLISTGTSFTPSVSNTVAKSYIYFVDVTNATCTSNMSSFTLTIKAPNCPSSPYVSVPTVCQGNEATITASGEDINWYNVETGGTAILSNSNTYTTNVAGNYYVTQTVNGCESPRTLAELVFTPKPDVSIKAPSEMKTTDTAVVITVSPLGGTLSGVDIFGSKFEPSAGSTGNQVISYAYTDPTTLCQATVVDTIVVIDGTINTKALAAEIALAQTEIKTVQGSSLVGNNDGQYPLSAVTELSEAIDSANSVVDSVKKNLSTTQANVNSATNQLTNALATFINSKIVGVNYGKLDSLISQAQNLVSTASTSIGTDVNQYPQSAVDSLKAAIVVAKNDSNSTQTVVNAEVTTLQNAINALNAAQVKGVVTQSISFSSADISINVGTTLSLTGLLQYYPSNASPLQLLWKSDNTSVATVDAQGNVTVIAAGVANITATSKNNPSISTSIPIQINAITGIAVIATFNPIVYPTVTSGVLYIKNAGEIENVTIISVLSNKTTIEAKTNADVIMLDVSLLPSGSYFALLKTRDGIVVAKQFIKE